MQCEEHNKITHWIASRNKSQLTPCGLYVDSKLIYWRLVQRHCPDLPKLCDPANGIVQYAQATGRHEVWAQGINLIITHVWPLGHGGARVGRRHRLLAVHFGTVPVYMLPPMNPDLLEEMLYPDGVYPNYANGGDYFDDTYNDSFSMPNPMFIIDVHSGLWRACTIFEGWYMLL